jgi:hypothetical protein
MQPNANYVSGVVSLINPVFINNGKILKGEGECDDVEIKGKYVILQTDHNDFKEKILRTIYNKGAATSICDYVIISDNVILICELKSKNTTGKSLQQKNTGRLISYLLQMVKEHSNIALPMPEIKYVCFAKKYHYKRKSKPNEKLERLEWEFDGGTHQTFHLPCNNTYYLTQFN